jgi:hypothetical protein
MWWSYILAAVGVTGLWLAGSDRAIGWAVGVAAQALWIAYAVTTQQWGFLVTAFAYGAVYIRGARKARRRSSTNRKVTAAQAA